MIIEDDLNRELSTSTYEELLSDFVNYYESKKYFLTVAQFGSVSFPGISDLDIFLLVKDNFLKRAKRDYENWIEKDQIKRYCLFHEPVTVTPKILSYLKYTHTLYDLRIIKTKYENPLSIVCSNKNLLSLSWTTFLITIVNSILSFTDNVSARKNLLILKNLHQSELNLGGRDNVLKSSYQLREQALKYDNSDEVLEEMRETVQNIFTLLDQEFGSTGTDGRKDIFFNISRNVKLIKSEKSYLREGNIYINKGIYKKFVKTLRSYHLSEEVQTYYSALSMIKKIAKDEGTSHSSVKPFNYPFYESALNNSLKSNIRNYFL